MKLIKVLIKVIIYIVSLGIIVTTSLKLALYFFIVKPISKEIAYDVRTYVEANNRVFTDEMLNSYVAKYKTGDRWIAVRYTQYANDRRFSVNVDVEESVSSLGIISPTAHFQTQGINLDNTPTHSVTAIYNSSYSDNKTRNDKNETKEESDLEKTSQDIMDNNDKNEMLDNQSVINEAEVEDFVEKFVKTGMKAIEDKEFSYVEHLLDPNGKAYNQSQTSITDINSKGKREELLKFKAKDVIEINKMYYKVFTYEEYKITYNDGSEVIKGYNSEYLVKKSEDRRLVMNEILKADEILNHELNGVSEVTTDDLLNRTCISCHGSNLEGGVGPPLNNLGQRFTEDEVVHIIENGKGYMPGGLLSQEQARDVAKYLLSESY